MTLALWAAVSLTLGAGPRPIVALTFVGDDADQAAFSSSLSELLMRLDVDLALRQTDAPLPKDALLAIVSADWSDPTAVTLNIQDAQSRVVLVRRLTRSGSPSLVIEASTHIVQSVIEEMAHPTVLKLSPPPVLSAAVVLPKPLEPELPREGVSLSVGAFGIARMFAAGPRAAPAGPHGEPPGPAVGAGGGIRLEAAAEGGRWRPAGWLTAQAQAPFGFRDQGFDLSLQVVPLRVGAGLALLNGDSVRLDAALGVGADVFVTSPSSRDLPAERVKGERVDASAILTAGLAFHLAVSKSSDVWLALNVDFDPMKPRWVATRGTSAPFPIFDPWPVRPSLVLGFSFSALGPNPFAASIGAYR